MNLRDRILAAQDLQRAAVEVPEWPDEAGAPTVVYVRMMTVRDRETFEGALVAAGGGDGKRVVVPHFRARLVALCAVDADGQRLFSEDDIEALADKSAQAITRISNAAFELNKLGDEAVREQQKN